MHYYSYEVGKTLYGLAMSDVLPNNNLWRGCKYEFLLESNYDHSDGYTVEVDFPPSNWTTWQNSKYFDPRRHHYHRKWTCAIYWKHVGAQTGLTVMVEFGANKHKNPTTHVWLRHNAVRWQDYKRKQVACGLKHNYWKKDGNNTLNHYLKRAQTAERSYAVDLLT